MLEALHGLSGGWLGSNDEERVESPQVCDSGGSLRSTPATLVLVSPELRERLFEDPGFFSTVRISCAGLSISRQVIGMTSPWAVGNDGL